MYQTLSVQPRQLWMDVLRAFAVFLVVLYHAAAKVEDTTGVSLPVVQQFNELMHPFRMPTLMFLSGMLLTVSLRKPAKIYVIGKLAKIGWPYLVWSAVILGMTAGLSSLTGNTSVTWGTVLRVFYDPPTYLWYLAYIVVFYLVALVLPPRARTLGVVAAFVLTLVLQGHPDWPRFFYMLGFFLLGDLVSRYGALLPRLLSSGIALTLAAVIACATGALAILNGGANYHAVWAVGTTAGIVVLAKLAMVTSATRAGRYLSRYGADSLTFYVTHWVGISVVCNGLSLLGLDNAALLMVGSLVGGLGIGYLFHRARRAWKPVNYLFELPMTRSGARQAKESRV